MPHKEPTTLEKIIENIPKYKNGSKAIPKDEIVVQYSALHNTMLDEAVERIKKLMPTVKNASVFNDVEFHTHDEKEMAGAVLNEVLSTLQELKSEIR